jgi:hypothetical protein
MWVVKTVEKKSKIIMCTWKGNCVSALNNQYNEKKMLVIFFLKECEMVVYGRKIC